MSRAGGVVAAVLAVLVSACSAGAGDGASDSRDETPESARTVPELEREWQVTSYATIPQSWNERYWLSDYRLTSLDASGMTSIGTGLKMFDALTGKRIKLDLGGHACDVPEVRPGDTHAVVRVSAQPPDTFYSKAEHFAGERLTPPRRCDGLAVLDLTTGRKAWGWPTGSKGDFRYQGHAFGAVMVRFADGRPGCFDLADGRALSVDFDEKCVVGKPYLTPLLDEHGTPLKKLAEQEEVGRIDGVLLVRGQLPSGQSLVRAHDLETGLTLWVDEVDPDPNGYSAWNRAETYATSPESLLRIRYEFEPDEDDPSQHVPTYAFISRVDPRTGEEIEQVGKVEQGLFLAQVGATAVMGVDQDLGMGAHLAGFRIPTAG